jgi:tetratricopeptide (TPR) repeat protein
MMQHSSLLQGVRVPVLLPLLLALLLPFHARVSADQTNWLSQAEERLRQGDREGALRAFQQAAWQRPQDANLHYNMGVLAESLGRLGEAVEDYLAYLRWAPQAADQEKVKGKVFQLCGELGAEAYRNGRYVNALDWYEKAKALYPHARALHFNLSRVYEARGEWDKAAAALKEYHTLCEPGQRESAKKWVADCLRKAAETKLGDRDYAGALAKYQEAAKWDEGDSRLLVSQALCEEKMGLFEEAKNHYLAYLQIDPMTPQREEIRKRIVHLHALLAEEHLTRGYYGLAQDVLTKGMEIDPENPEFFHLAAKASLGLGQQEQAVAYLERILALSSEESEKGPYAEELVRLCTSLADEAYRKQKFPDAQRLLKKALYWTPENPLINYNLARVYERQEEWEQAVLAYRRYLFLDPDAAERNEVKAKLAYYYYFLGKERFEKGEYPQAQEAFEQALLVRPEDPALLYNLSAAFLKRGKTAEALHFLERYVQYEQDPEQIEQARRQMNRLVSLTEQSRRGDSGRSVSSGLAALEERSAGLEAEDHDVADRKKGYLFLQAGRWQEALEVYEQCLRRTPGVGKEEGFQREIATALRELSRAALLAGNLEEALKHLGRARQWAPDEAFPYLWSGQVYEHRGESAEALETYRGSLLHVRGEQGRGAIRERIVALLTQRLQTALQRENLPDALSALSALEPYLSEGQARDVHYQKARIEGALGRKEQALAEFGLHLFESPDLLQDPGIRQEMLSLAQGDPELLASIDDPADAYRKAKKWAGRGEHGKALLSFLVARSGERARPDLDAEILRSLAGLGMEAEALPILSRSPSQERPFVLPKAETGQVLRRVESALQDDYRNGNYERGLARIRGLQARLSEPDLRLRLLEGVFEEMAGRYDEAILRYEGALHAETVLPFDPDTPLSKRLGVLLIRKALDAYNEGNYETCLEALRRAERVVPGRADVAFDLGCVYLRLRKPQRALQAFSRYLELVQEESPRRKLTSRAIPLLQGRLARSPVVQYDGSGIAVDLIFERPVSLGDLFVEEGEQRAGQGEELLDSVVLAPYLDIPAGG